MIQTPILDTALQTNVVKDIAPSQQPTRKPSGAGAGASSTLKDRLESQRGSQSLSIVDLFIGDEGAYEIARFLKQNKDYTSIQLRGNNISAAGFEAICQALKGFNNLRDITAEWNNIGSDISGLVALHQLLKVSNSVETVDLKNNRLGPNCGRVVGDIIKDSNSLKKIDLRWNELGNEGGQAILRALQESQKAISVDLSGNKIHEETLAQIDLLHSNKPSRPVVETTKKAVYGQQTPSVENKVAPIQTRFSNSAFPTKYGSSMNSEQTATFNASSSTYGRLVETKQESVGKSEVHSRKAGQHGSAYRPATPPREGNLQTLSVNTNSRISERPATQDTKKYSYLADRKTYNAANDNYSSPRRLGLENMMDDVTERIEITKSNIERYSPTHKSKENFRYDTASRANFDVKQDIRRSTQGHDLASTYKFRQVQMTPSANDIKNDLHATNTLRRSVNVRQEADDGNLKVGKLISDLERALEREQLRAIEAESRFNALANDYEMEQVLRQDLEKKHSQIIEELRRRDLEVNELRIALDDFERENITLKADVNRLARENERLDEFNKAGLAQIEDKYINQLKQADSHSHSLKLQLEEVQHELNGQVMSLRRELDERCRNYEDQIVEFSKMNDELSNELSSQLEFIEKLKVEHQEHLTKTIAQARQEEIAKAQIVIRDLEGQLAALGAANDQLAAKNAEMLQDLQGYEKQIREQHIQFANELARLGAELDRLRAELNQAHVVIQKQESELVARDGIIHQLKGDVDRMRVEIQRLAEEHARQIDHLKRDFENERRRFGDNERQLIMNIEELEKRLIESQNETVIITREYDRLVEIIKGNVTKAIHDTFVTHKNTSEIRHIEHRTTAVNRPMFK